jgi:SMI1 / KNR4 family (SUKH-1)
MATDFNLQKILAIDKLEIPKTSPYDPTLVREVFGGNVEETDRAWLIPCTHSLNPPASLQQVRDAEAKLGMVFPAQLSILLELCDGAKLFVAAQAGRDESFPKQQHLHVRYRLFGSEELVDVNRGLWSYFKSRIDGYPEHQNLSGLNYVALGDATNGDYYGIGLDGEKKDQVFLVHHELEYRPF